jgi:hypothetical protein
MINFKSDILFIFSFFSNWIFIWFILYYFSIIKYNPIGWLIIAILVSIIQLLLLLYVNSCKKSIIIVSLIIIFKMIMIILCKKTINMEDIKFSIILFSIYNLLLGLINKNIIILYLNLSRDLINCKSNLLNLLKKWIYS